MGDEWPIAALGDIAENHDSRRVPLSSRERATRQGPYPYYGATGVMDQVDGFLYEGLHTLIAEDGSVEREDGTPFVQLVDGKFWVNNHAHVLRAADDDDTRYLYYALSNVKIRPFVTGSVQAKLSQRNLRSVTIPYPRREDRRAVVHVLRALDDKIELNRRMNETLEAMARAIFKSWFVDFDPVRAKAEGRQPVGMNADTAALFPDSFQDSPLGPIPEGWGLVTIADLAHYVNGRNFTKGATGDGRMVIRIAELNSGPGASTVYNDVAASDDNLARPGDLLFAWSGSLDVYRWHRDEALVNQHIFKVIPDGYPAWFVFHHLEEAMPFFRGIASGKATTMGHIRRGDLDGVPIGVSPPRLLAAADELLWPLFDAALWLERENLSLAETRDTLLPRLISGELRVPDAERAASEVV